MALIMKEKIKFDDLDDILESEEDGVIGVSLVETTDEVADMVKKLAESLSSEMGEFTNKMEKASKLLDLMTDAMSKAVHTATMVSAKIAPDLSAKQAQGVVEVQTKSGGIVTSSSAENFTPLMTPPIPADDLCHVHVTGKRTINLGNFESASVTIGITVPCKSAELDAAYQYSTQWVDAKMQDASGDLKKE